MSMAVHPPWPCRIQVPCARVILSRLPCNIYVHLLLANKALDTSVERDLGWRGYRRLPQAPICTWLPALSHGSSARRVLARSGATSAHALYILVHRPLSAAFSPRKHMTFVFNARFQRIKQGYIQLDVGRAGYIGDHDKTTCVHSEKRSIRCQRV